MEVFIGPLIVFAIAYVLIVTELTDRTAAAVFGATIVIALGFIPYHEAVERIDLNVVFLLVGMMIVVNILSDTGLFEWVAIKIAQVARGNGLVILAGLSIATAVLSALLDNVTTVVLIAPVTILIVQILELRAVPFLIVLALFSNIGGTATLIGDPPNILIGSAVGLSFVEFVIHLTPAVLIIMVACLLVLGVVLRSSMQVDPDARALVRSASPNRAIVDPMRLRRGLIVFAGIMAALCVSHSLHVEPGIIALAGGFVMILVCRTSLHEALSKVEWNTIFFLIGLFMLVGSLEYVGVFEVVGEYLIGLTGGGLIATAMVVLWVSAVLGAVAGNIPVVIALIPLTQILAANIGNNLGLEPELVRAHVTEPLFWALALGACLGGNGTLYGAAANIVIAQIAERNNYHISFSEFLKYGLPITVISLLLSMAYLYLRYFAFSPIL
jgi:Na+/H+ antiporter NhaD/arsenite permease-like protein